MTALLLVDIQYDFLPGGALEVKQGDKVIPVANKLVNKFELVVATQDWHPENHGSFASNHANKKPLDVIDLYGLEQILWPDHCVQETNGAQIAKDLNTKPVEAIFRKGMEPEIDTYSGFFDNGHKKDTGLDAYLKSKKVDKVFIVGLAADFCVKETATDAIDLGYQTIVVQDGTYAVQGQEGFDKTKKELREKGVEFKHSDELT
ncbi:MAG: bifunctional nicotinamidase/pyrazinamidase [Bacteroidales bacterium]|nr:bifunctional nicotinamidase/pyrazinamidase [Bacteroidales bacterium]